MKRSLCLVLVLPLVVGLSAMSGAGPAQAKPRGMTLRLELFVRDLEKAVDFYTNVLGFERLKRDVDYAPVRSGSVVLGLGPAAGLSKTHYFNPELQSQRHGLGTEIVLEVDDVTAFHETVKSKGYKGHLTPLRKQAWGSTDFRIADPDGYYLRVTSRPDVR